MTYGNTLKLSENAATQSFVSAWNDLASNPPELQADDKLVRYHYTKLLELLESSRIETMPYALMFKVLYYIEVHAG